MQTDTRGGEPFGPRRQDRQRRPPPLSSGRASRASWFRLLTIVGLVTIRGRSGLIAAMERRGHSVERLHDVMEYGSAVLVLLPGAGFFLLYLPM